MAFKTFIALLMLSAASLAACVNAGGAVHAFGGEIQQQLDEDERQRTMLGELMSAESGGIGGVIDSTSHVASPIRKKTNSESTVAKVSKGLPTPAATSAIRQQRKKSESVSATSFTTAADRVADSTPGTTSSVLKQRISGSVAADGSIKVVASSIASMPGASRPVWKDKISDDVDIAADSMVSNGRTALERDTASPIRKRKAPGSVTIESGGGGETRELQHTNEFFSSGIKTHFAGNRSKAAWSPLVRRTERTGKVDALYTFGSPSISAFPVKNEQSNDGCFPGKRVYAVNMTSPNDPISAKTQDWAATLLPLIRSRTPMQDIVAIIVDSKKQFEGHVPTGWSERDAELIEYYGQEVHKPCSRIEARAPLGLPALGSEGDILHKRTYYFNYSDAVLMKKWTVARGFSQHDKCLSARYGINEITNFQVKDPFKVDFVDDPFLAGSYDYDSVHLFQDESSLKCYLSFRSADYESPFDMANQLFGKTWCGMKGLGKFVVEELEVLMQSPEWTEKIQQNLPKCNGLELTGHSMGGSISGILAACLNKNSWDKATYDSVLWEFEQPEKLQPLHQCLDVTSPAT